MKLHTRSLQDSPCSLDQFRRARDLAPGNFEYASAYAETFYLMPQPDWQGRRSIGDGLRHDRRGFESEPGAAQ